MASPAGAEIGAARAAPGGRPRAAPRRHPSITIAPAARASAACPTHPRGATDHLGRGHHRVANARQWPRWPAWRVRPRFGQQCRRRARRRPAERRRCSTPQSSTARAQRVRTRRRRRRRRPRAPPPGWMLGPPVVGQRPARVAADSSRLAVWKPEHCAGSGPAPRRRGPGGPRSSRPAERRPLPQASSDWRQARRRKTACSVRTCASSPACEAAITASSGSREAGTHRGARLHQRDERERLDRRTER